MASTASVEIHQLNVGQGDCIIIINRDAAKLDALCRANGFVGSDAIDCLPYALKEIRKVTLPR